MNLNPDDVTKVLEYLRGAWPQDINTMPFPRSMVVFLIGWGLLTFTPQNTVVLSAAGRARIGA